MYVQIIPELYIDIWPCWIYGPKNSWDIRKCKLILNIIKALHRCCAGFRYNEHGAWCFVQIMCYREHPSIPLSFVDILQLQPDAPWHGLNWYYDHDCATWYMIHQEHASQLYLEYVTNVFCGAFLCYFQS